MPLSTRPGTDLGDDRRRLLGPEGGRAVAAPRHGVPPSMTPSSRGYARSVAFHACKAHTKDYLLFCCGNIARILTGWLLVIALLLLLAFALEVSAHYSRLWIFSWFLATPFFIFLERQLFSKLIGPLVNRRTAGRSRTSCPKVVRQP